MLDSRLPRAKIGGMKAPSVKKGFSCTGRYGSDVKAYGKPPKGFRFLEVGETSDPKTDYFLLFGYERWAKETVPTKIDDTLYLFIRRLPETHADSNLLRRVDDLRAKIVASQKLIVTASERLDKYAEILKTLEAVK